MATCQYCSQENRVGVLICERCGRPLTDVGTRMLEESRPDVNRELSKDGKLTEDFFIALHLKGAEAPLVLLLAPEIILGRFEETEAEPPYVDLSAYEAREKGVSRIHASIKRHGMRAVLVDVGSSNGTSVNGQAIDPNEEVILFDGDKIHLGKLGIRIQFR